jgi:hypothetical protein
MYSELDFQLMKLWTMAFNDMRITDYNSFSDDYNVLLKEELYRCNADLVKDDKAVLELLKYTYKDSQIKNYKTFKSIINSLYSVKKKQGYGVLYGDFDFEGISLDGEKENEDLLKELLVVEETPVIVLTRLPNLLNKQYQKYKKISIHNLVEEMVKIDDRDC